MGRQINWGQLPAAHRGLWLPAWSSDDQLYFIQICGRLDKSNSCTRNWGERIGYSGGTNPSPMHTIRPPLQAIIGGPVYSPAFDGTHCAYPRRDDQAELTWLLAGYILIRLTQPQTVTHPMKCKHVLCTSTTESEKSIQTFKLELTGKLDVERLAALGNVTRSTLSESSSKPTPSRSPSALGTGLSIRQARFEAAAAARHEVEETPMWFQTGNVDVDVMPIHFESTTS